MAIDPHVLDYLINSPGLDRRVRLYLRQGGLCHWCGRPMVIGKPFTRPTSVTEDHLMARAYGGPSTMANLVGACWRCNSLRYELSAVFFSHLVKIFGPHLPEYNTPAFAKLQRAVRHALDGRTIRVRIPVQSRQFVCEGLANSDTADSVLGRERVTVLVSLPAHQEREDNGRREDPESVSPPCPDPQGQRHGREGP